MAGINLYPTYLRNVHDNMVDIEPFTWSYERDNVARPLEVKGGIVSDQNEAEDFWNANDYEIRFSGSITFNMPSSFYPNGEHDIAHTNAKIGLAIVWSSPSSFQRGVFQIGEIENQDTPKTIPFDCELPKGSFRDFIQLETILYIKDAGTNPSEEEIGYANEPGFVIATLDVKSLVIDGNSSAFPNIRVRKGRNAPLWSIKCSWTDPMSDLFEDSVLLEINTDSPYADCLNQDNDKFDQSLLREIIASAYALIVEKLRSEDIPVDNLGDEPEYGSVCMVVKYLKDTLRCDFSSPIETSESIRSKVENEFLN